MNNICIHNISFSGAGVKLSNSAKKAIRKEVGLYLDDIYGTRLGWNHGKRRLINTFKPMVAFNSLLYGAAGVKVIADGNLATGLCCLGIGAFNMAFDVGAHIISMTSAKALVTWMMIKGFTKKEELSYAVKTMLTKDGGVISSNLGRIFSGKEINGVIDKTVDEIRKLVGIQR